MVLPVNYFVDDINGMIYAGKIKIDLRMRCKNDDFRTN